MSADAMPAAHPGHRAASGSLLSLAAIGLMLACLLLGGATRENALLVAILELMALPIALVAGWRLVEARALPGLAVPLIILGAIVLLPLLQLIPLPFETWAQLPGRAGLAEALQRAGAAPAALPMSVTPDLTQHSVLALLPPVAVFLATVQMPAPARRRAVEVVLVVVLASIVLGLLQIATGQDSPLRLYERTNVTSAVGFFANRNHQAALLVTAIPLAAAWAVDRGDKSIRWLALALAVLAVASIGVVRSRAGILLAAPALAGAMLVILRGSGGNHGRRRMGLAFGAVALASGLLTAAMWGGDIVDRFEDRAENEMRLNVLPQMLALAEDYAPWGSGIGSFDAAYRVMEPVESVQPAFLNHAHNDYAEVWIEAGVAGAVLVVAFLLWAVVAGFKAWRASGPRVGAAYGRAASLVVFLLVAHSAADYPLRSLALAGLFAFACGLIATPPPPSRR